jgi:hypothetical protein
MSDSTSEPSIKKLFNSNCKFDSISGALGSLHPKMAPRFLNLVDLHRKFYKLPWLACGRYKLVRQSVEITLHPA